MTELINEETVDEWVNNILIMKYVNIIEYIPIPNKYYMVIIEYTIFD